MREKVMRLLVTFHSTAAAMAMEKGCGEAGVPGRIIPVPTSITAGCGLCWISPPEERERVEDVLRRATLEASGVYEMPV